MDAYVLGTCRACGAKAKIAIEKDCPTDKREAYLEKVANVGCPGRGRPHVAHGSAMAAFSFERELDGTIKAYETAPKETKDAKK